MKLHCIETYDKYLFENTPDHTVSKGYSTPNFQIRPYTRMTEEEFEAIHEEPDFLKKIQPKPQLGADHQPFRMRVLIRPLNVAGLRVRYEMETRRVRYEFTGAIDPKRQEELKRELKEIEIIICQNWDAFTDYSNDKALYPIYEQLPKNE